MLRFILSISRKSYSLASYVLPKCIAKAMRFLKPVDAREDACPLRPQLPYISTNKGGICSDVRIDDRMDHALSSRALIPIPTNLQTVLLFDVTGPRLSRNGSSKAIDSPMQPLQSDCAQCHDDRTQREQPDATRSGQQFKDWIRVPKPISKLIHMIRILYLRAIVAKAFLHPEPVAKCDSAGQPQRGQDGYGPRWGKQKQIHQHDD